MAQYATLKAAINAVIKANGQKEITGTVLNQTLKAMVNSLGANYQFVGVATPSANPGTPDQNVFYLAGQGGTYTNFNNIAIPNGISLLMWNGSWSSQTVLSGDGGVFDISAYKATGGTLATFADLSAALGENGENVPIKFGGMQVRFVSSSDNNYVQYRCIAEQFTTDITQWSFCGNDVYKENPRFARAITDSEGKLAWGIDKEGKIYFGAGVPPQVKEFVEEFVALFEARIKEIYGDYEEHPEYARVIADSVGRILFAFNSEDGKPYFPLNEMYHKISNPEWTLAFVDEDGKVVIGLRRNGDVLINGRNVLEEIDIDKEDITTIKEFIDYNPVPAYYKDYIKTKADEVNAMADESGIYGDSFVFITDYHSQSNVRKSPSLIEYLFDKTGVRNCVFCGDTQDKEYTPAAAVKKLVDMKTDFINIWDKMYCVIGNHEYNCIWQRDEHGTIIGIEAIYVSVNQIYNLLIKDKEECFVWRNAYGDYAFDNKVQKIRYFTLGCHPWCEVVPGQAESIIAAFAEVPAGYNIVLLSHLSLTINNTYGTTVWDTLKPIVAALDALNNRENFSITYTYPIRNGMEGSGQTYTFAADYRNSQARAMCVIGGHVHYDRDLGYPYTGGYQRPSLQIIATTCDAIDRQGDGDNPNGYIRMPNTISEQAFDVVHLDVENSVVYCKRIGCGYDRIYHTDVKSVSIGSTITLTPVIQGTLTWSASCGNVTTATVSNGVVTGAAQGNAFVTAVNENNEREVFLIIVE